MTQRRWLVTAAAALATAAAVVALAGQGGAGRTSSAAGAPDLSGGTSGVQATVLPVVASYAAVDTTTGASVSIADLRGRPALLAAWATWCVPCRTELPALQELADERAGSGLRVVLVNVDSPATNDDEVTAWLRSRGIRLDGWRDPDERFGRVFMAPVLPASVLLDADGAVVERWLGALRPHDRDVAAALDRVSNAHDHNGSAAPSIDVPVRR